MQELINRLTEKAGVTTEQATKSIEAIKEFVKEKFPMMAGAVDNLLGATAPTNNHDSAPPVASSSMVDRISDVIPGEMGEKVEDFVKNAADKLGDMFGGDKK